MLKLACEKWENAIHQNTNELISEQTWLLWGRTDGGCQLLWLLCVFIDTKSASLTERRIKGLQLTHTVKWSEQKFKNVSAQGLLGIIRWTSTGTETWLSQSSTPLLTTRYLFLLFSFLTFSSEYMKKTFKLKPYCAASLAFGSMLKCVFWFFSSPLVSPPVWYFIHIWHGAQWNHSGGGGS